MKDIVGDSFLMRNSIVSKQQIIKQVNTIICIMHVEDMFVEKATLASFSIFLEILAVCITSICGDLCRLYTHKGV